MAFALCPDDGPPRLWRFVEPNEVMVAERLVSVLDAKQNLLTINRVLFDQLGELQQLIVLRTHNEHEYI